MPFLVFVGRGFYPQGGAFDLVGVEPTLEEAQEKAGLAPEFNPEYEWANIIEISDAAPGLPKTIWYLGQTPMVEGRIEDSLTWIEEPFEVDWDAWYKTRETKSLTEAEKCEITGHTWLIGHDLVPQPNGEPDLIIPKRKCVRCGKEENR